MSKLLLLSVMIATLAIPIRASRDPSYARGLRRTVRQYLLFMIVYVFACLVVYPRLL